MLIHITISNLIWLQFYAMLLQFIKCKGSQMTYSNYTFEV